VGFGFVNGVGVRRVVREVEVVNLVLRLKINCCGLCCDPSTENRTEKLSYISKRFEVSGRHLIISGMPAFSVIKHFNIIKNRSLSLFSRFVAFVKNTFSFERMKKAFSHGVIPAIAFATHVLLNMMLFKQSPMFF
jgi:hypothetical protein